FCATLAAATLSGKPGSGDSVSAAPGLREALRAGLRLVRQPGLAILLGTIVIPSALVVAGVLWYLVPLHVGQLGGSSSAIARILMFYYVASAILSSPAAAWAEARPGDARWMVVGGSLLTGSALAITPLAGADWLLGCVVALAGV